MCNFFIWAEIVSSLELPPVAMRGRHKKIKQKELSRNKNNGNKTKALNTFILMPRNSFYEEVE